MIDTRWGWQLKIGLAVFYKTNTHDPTYINSIIKLWGTKLKRRNNFSRIDERKDCESNLMIMKS